MEDLVLLENKSIEINGTKLEYKDLVRIVLDVPVVGMDLPLTTLMDKMDLLKSVRVFEGDKMEFPLKDWKILVDCLKMFEKMQCAPPQFQNPEFIDFYRFVMEIDKK